MKKTITVLAAIAMAAVAQAGGPDAAFPFQHPSLLPAIQTIGAGGTVAADACGGLKRISATAARTTDTTNTFSAPSARNLGCRMVVFNAGTFVITLDANANFATPASANVVLGTKDAVTVLSLGSYWAVIGTSDNLTTN